MASGIYNSFVPKSLTTAAGHTLKAALLNGYTFVATHSTYADLTNEVSASGTNYTTGGATLVSPTVTTTAANSWGRAWATGTAYKLGQIVRPSTGNTYLYRCSVAGTSHGSTEPTWPTTVGLTVTDNGITWTCVGTYAITLTATNPAWASATITATGVAVYDTSDSDQLIAYQDFSATTTSTNGTFTVTTFASNEGILDICK